MSLNDLRSSSETPPPPRRRHWSVWFFPLLLLLLGLAFLWTQKDRLLPAQKVLTATAQGLALSDAEADSGPGLEPLFVAPGWAEARPFASEAAALVAGTLREVRVIDGQKVAKDELIATLIDDEFRLAVKAAEAELALEVAELEVRRPRLARANGEIDAQKAELRSLAVQVELAQGHLKRLESAGNAVAEMDLLHARSELAQAAARLQAQEATIPVKTAALREVEAELKSGEARIALFQVKLERARLDLERCAIRSPIDGIVLSRRAQPGQRLMPDGQTMISASVAEIYDPATLQVRADVPLADAARLSSGQPVKVIFDLLPERNFPGTVSSINGSADLTRNTLQCKIALGEHEPRLRAAMIAKVTFLSPPKAADAAKTSAGSSARQRIFIPKDALTQPHPAHFVVWIATPEDKAHALTVTPGRGERSSEGQIWIEILQGVLPGQRVILKPRELKEGARIQLGHS